MLRGSHGTYLQSQCEDDCPVPTTAYRASRQMDPSPAGSSSAEPILCPSTALSAGEMTVAQADSHPCPLGACLLPEQMETKFQKMSERSVFHTTWFKCCELNRRKTGGQWPTSNRLTRKDLPGKVTFE